MKSFSSWMRARPLSVAVVALLVGLAGIWFVPSDGTLVGMVPVRAVLALLMLGVMAGVAGRRAVAPSFKGFALTFRTSAYLLVMALAGGVLGLSASMGQGDAVLGDWPWQLVVTIVLCLFIGLFEEGLFRGVVLSGLLARMGATRAGVMGAAVVSSLVFGFVHVLPFILYGQVADALGIAQAALKTVETGIMGLLMAAIFIKTRNLWAVVAVHGLNDLFPLLSSALYEGTLSADYVSSDPAVGLVSVVVYLAFLLLYLPILVAAVRMLKRVELPCSGLFVQPWAALSVKAGKKAKERSEAERKA